MATKTRRRPRRPHAAPLIHPAAEADADLALEGPSPTWRRSEEPIYLEMVERYGVPGTGIGGGPVVRGEVIEP